MIVVAMIRCNAVASRIVATTRHASRMALKTRVTQTTMRDKTNVAQARTMHSAEASAFRLNTATGNMWSMTGAATT